MVLNAVQKKKTKERKEIESTRSSICFLVLNRMDREAMTEKKIFA